MILGRRRPPFFNSLLAEAIAIALASILIRKMAETETNAAIVFYFTLFGIIVGAMTLPFDYVRPGLTDLLLLIAIGVLGGFAQILRTKAFGLAPTSVVAPFEYAALVFALMLGFIVWAEFPTPIEMAGMIVIVCANSFVAFLK
ncbi:EamA family transporter [Bradyrhizobium sp. USDA 4508]